MFQLHKGQLIFFIGKHAVFMTEFKLVNLFLVFMPDLSSFIVFCELLSYKLNSDFLGLFVAAGSHPRDVVPSSIFRNKRQKLFQNSRMLKSHITKADVKNSSFALTATAVTHLEQQLNGKFRVVDIAVFEFARNLIFGFVSEAVSGISEVNKVVASRRIFYSTVLGQNLIGIVTVNGIFEMIEKIRHENYLQ